MRPVRRAVSDCLRERHRHGARWRVCAGQAGRSSLLAPAADAEDRLAGDVRGVVRSEEARDVRLLFGLRHSLDHELRRGVGRETGARHFRDHRRIGRAGAEAVGTDAVLGKLHGNALRHRGDRALAGSIRRRVRARATDVDGGRVDDGALGLVRHEGTRGSLCAVEAAKVIVVNDAGVLFLGDIEEVLEQIDAGVAEHDIKAVELVISGLNERIDLRSVGDINESDVTLASASSAIIIGFNVRPDTTAKQLAEQEGVDLRLYKVIYQAIEDVEAAMKGMLDPVFEEKVIGHAEVRQLFKASGVGTIAGSYVLDGTFQRNCKVRITRGEDQIFEGELASLKRFKDDVKEVRAGYECGLVFNDFNDVKEEDKVEAYIMVEVPR